MAYFSINNINPIGAVTINSSASTIGIGNDAVAQAINIGTGGAARTITVGNNTGATALDVNLGTGGLTVDCEDGGAISLDANGAPSNFTLTSTADADDFTIALAGSTDSSLILSSTGTAVDALQVTASAGGMDIIAAKTMDITTSANDANITIDPHGSGTLALGSADNTAVNIGALAITATSVNALTLTDGTASLALAGTGATSISGATTLDLDCTGAFTINSSAGIISIGNDEDAFGINIGTGAAARPIIIGNTTTSTSVNIISGASGDITLDAGGADIFLKDGGTTYGSLTQNGGELLIKSGTTPTTALTFSGANITTGGTLQITTVAVLSSGDFVTSPGVQDGFLVIDKSATNLLKQMTAAEVATAISAVTTSAANTFTNTNKIDIAATNFNPSSDGSHLHIEGGVDMTDQDTSNSGTASQDYKQVSIEAVTLKASNTSVTTTNASTLFINNAPTASTNQTITNTYALNIDNGASKFGGNVEFSVQEATSTITSTPGAPSSLAISKSVVLLSHVGSASTQTYTVGDGTDGQIVHFFFATEASDQIIKLDFGDDNTSLASGSGLARYLTFNVTGQSATLVFTADRTLNLIVIAKCWRIINTGAAVS